MLYRLLLRLCFPRRTRREFGMTLGARPRDVMRLVLREGAVQALAGLFRGLREPVGQWWLKSVAIGGREMLDAPLELRQSADDAVVVFSDRASALTGVVRDAGGTPVADVWVVAFAAHPPAWFHNSRRVAAVKTGADGTYAIRNLPAGAYHVAAAFDLDTGEWFDPAVLKMLVPASARIEIAEHEQKTADVVTR